MFTGIIEEQGIIRRIVPGRTRTVTIRSGLSCRDGDSISVNGVCLTVTAAGKKEFSVEAVIQTRDVTTLPSWKAGDKVNLERALAVGDRLGGHFVLGHVDEKGMLVRIAGNEYIFRIPARHRKYLVPKGSIAIDGISLTIGKASGGMFSVYVIPHTLKNTTLRTIHPGSFVNVEYDYLAKIRAR